MMDVRSLSDEIANLDKVIQAIEGQLNEARQQREFKMALLRQLQKPEIKAINNAPLVQQRTDVISE
jgi:hypothetical protein